MATKKPYQEEIECRVECKPSASSTVRLVPDRWDTFYNGNPDFQLDLSNFNQEVSISGFYRIHGINYQQSQTVIMISSKETGKLLHNLVVKGIHDLKKSMIVGYNEEDKDSTVDGLKSSIDGKEYYNSRCDNLNGIITCKPLVKKGVELPTQFYLCDNIPSKESGLTIVDGLSGNHLINYSEMTRGVDQPLFEEHQDKSLIKFYDFADNLVHSVEVDYSGNVQSLVRDAEYANSNICTYFA